MSPKVKAVIFDVGGVLALGRKTKDGEERRTLSVHKFVAKKLGISIDQYLDAIDSAYTKSTEGKISRNEVVKTISKNLKTTPKKLERIYFKAYKRKFKQNKPLYNFAFKFEKKGYKIGILSDQWHLSKEATMPKKYTKRFNSVVVSCDVGLRKPDPKIFRLILKKLKVSPSEAIFIDNQKWNIDAAKKLGMKTIVFKNNKQLRKELSKHITV